MADPLTICRRLAEAPEAAWKGIQGRSDLNERVGMGADGTPTTVADAALDAAMLDVAEELDITILSEEAGLVDHGSRWTAVVDPLDGSRNAGRGIPFYCTSVAVGSGSLLGLEAALVIDLTCGDRYEAERGRGARLNGRPVHKSLFDPREVLVAVAADYDDPMTVERMQRKHHHIRDLGSAAMEMCLVGTGALDAFDVRKDWLRVIDIAAATLFVREADGIVLDPATGEDLDTPFDLGARTGVLAAKDRQALEAVL